MPDSMLQDRKIKNKLEVISEFTDYQSLQKIINKLTDYSEVIPEGKLSGIINYNFNLNSSQTDQIIELLVETRGLSRIYNLALKGSRDLESEYISNIFTDTITPYNSSSYISLRNIIENRLNHQIQQYNMNMSKNNTTMAMPINELKGHVKTYDDLSENNIAVSTKAQHGVISASLHDAYVIILNRPEWWDDRTYMKYFFNETDPSKEHLLITTKKDTPSLQEIETEIKKVMNEMNIMAIEAEQKSVFTSDSVIDDTPLVKDKREKIPKEFNDKMMNTPFGKQYGNRVDEIILELFDEEKERIDEEELKVPINELFISFRGNPESLQSSFISATLDKVGQNLLFSQLNIKSFAEFFIHSDKKESFTNFYTEEVKKLISDFLNCLYFSFFEMKFASVFRIIKSSELRKFACAFIIKRIYLIEGENITTFGYFFIKSIGRSGKIKVSSS